MRITSVATYMLTIGLTVLGCSRPRPAQEQAQEHDPPSEAGVTFVNKVWQVAESSGVAPGQLTVFLSEGTLVFASPYGTPTLSTWKYDGRSLTMVEEGIPYPVDILSLTRTEFRIRSHHPGGFVDIHYVPAEGPPLHLPRP